MSVLLGWLLCASLAADPAFVEGQSLYRALEYEQAIFRFQEIALRADLPAADRAEALVWLGLSYAGTGDLVSAKRNLKDALALDKSTVLPANASPRVQEIFAEAEREQQAAPAASTTTNPDPLKPAAAADAPAADGGGLFVPGAVVAGVGGAALVVGTVLMVVAVTSFQTANDPNEFQDAAKAALDRANGAAIGAGIVLPLGAIVGGAGVAMLVVSSLE